MVLGCWVFLHILVAVIYIIMQIVHQALTSEHILVLSYSFLNLKRKNILFLKLANLLTHNLGFKIDREQ